MIIAPVRNLSCSKRSWLGKYGQIHFVPGNFLSAAQELTSGFTGKPQVSLAASILKIPHSWSVSQHRSQVCVLSQLSRLRMRCSRMHDRNARACWSKENHACAYRERWRRPDWSNRSVSTNRALRSQPTSETQSPFQSKMLTLFRPGWRASCAEGSHDYVSV